LYLSAIGVEMYLSQPADHLLWFIC